MSAAEKSGWIKLAEYPYDYSSNIITTNKNELVTGPAILISSAIQPDGLLTFNLKKNDWEIFIEYPQSFQSSSNSLAYNHIRNELHLFGTQARILKINLNTKTTDLLPITQKFGSYPATIFINDVYHVIGGSNSNSHSIYNPKTNTFKSIYEFERLSYPKLIYSESRKMLYLFTRNSNKFGIWCCNMTNTDYKWTKTMAAHKLPNDFCDYEIAMINGEKSIAIFGGYYNDFYEISDIIYVMDLDTLEIKQSVIKCPERGSFRAACYFERGDDKYDLLINGFMREYNDGFVLNEIVKIIQGFSYRDYVHLVDKSNRSHWRIKIDEILSNLKDVEYEKYNE